MRVDAKGHGMRRSGVAASAAGLALIAGAAWAGPFDPPAGYYDAATGTGAALKSQLHQIISVDWHDPGSSTHNIQPYENAPKALAILHRLAAEDIDSEVQLLLYNAEVDTQVWSNGAGWNREHTWPRSRGISTTGADNSDLHMLRPCDSGVNGSRSNLPFGTGSGEWDPNALGGQDRGEIARCMFYADVRYDGADPETTDLSLVVGSPSGSQMGDLGELLRWHYDEPVDDRERFRNQLLWSNDGWDWEDTLLNKPITIPGFERPPISFFQGNRNPFIDRPEFVWTIWGQPLFGANNATLHVGAGPSPDGSSSATIDAGRVIAGSDAPIPGVSLTKLGTHPTTYDIVGSGLAASASRRGLAVPFDPQTITLDPVVLTSPATPGAFGATITIVNTELSSAGAGQGSDDGDDVVQIDALAVVASEASFDAGADLDSLSIDLGSVFPGGSSPVTIWALDVTPGLTASLDVDAAQGAGDTAVLALGSIPAIGVPAGGSTQIDVVVDAAAAPGSYKATYTIEVSDEDIPGASAGTPLTLVVSAIVVPTPACDGDVDGDGDTDVFDFSELASNFGAGPGATRSMGDLTGDGFVDVFDFADLAVDFGCGP
jgi:endonuclease I